MNKANRERVDRIKLPKIYPRIHTYIFKKKVGPTYDIYWHYRVDL